MDKWFGFCINFKYPHEGFCLGISIDFFEEEEKTPWSSIVVRILFLTLTYDFGFGDENKHIYNNHNR